MVSGRRGPRIIAGEAGGRRLAVPAGDGVRPTSDRVKESLFSALGVGRLVGARVLDLYAGSGALALEALSRGAAAAVLVERDRVAAAAITTNLETLGFADRARLRVGAVRPTLDGPPPDQPFDVVFLDPPYDSSAAEISAVVQRLVDGGWVADEATIVVERGRGSEPLDWPRQWGSTWERCYGDTLVLFAQRK